MTSYSFNTNVPFATDDPSDDQPDMKINNQSTNDILAVNHVTFNTANGGMHTRVDYVNTLTPGSVVDIDPISTAYTIPGVADPTHPQNVFTNSQGTFPLSALRAFGIFSLTTTPTIIYSYNVASIAFVATRTFNITLTANATSGNNVVCLVSMNTLRTAPSSVSSDYTYSFTAGVLTITFTNATFPSQLHVAFLQI